VKARNPDILPWTPAHAGDAPLSFAQQRLWFLDQLEPGTSRYTLASRQRFRGPLDIPALERAFTEIVRRHEVLRTTFGSREGRPVQRVGPPGPIGIPVVDLELHPPPVREEAVARIVRDETRRPFSLDCGPLVRCLLLRLGPDVHDLVVSIHHIVADGWSLGILAHELRGLYDAFAAGRASPLPELPVQYADFAAWQQLSLAGEKLQSQRRYWLAHLAGRSAPLQLPTDHPRSRVGHRLDASHDLVVPPTLADRLRTLSRQEGVTLFMLLLATFKVLLSRYTGQDDIVVGTPVANRDHVELEPLIGLFANTLVLRTDLGGDPTFRGLLARVRETCLEAYAHPDMPFEQLVEELRPPRTLGGNPLFEISVVFQAPGDAADAVPVTVGSPFEMTLFLRDAGHGPLGATLQYARDLFEPTTIAGLLRHYLTLLEGVATDPACRVSALPLLDPAEAHQLLFDWNATATSYPRDQSVNACFEGQVDSTPGAIALVADGVSMTYDVLDRRANRLAHHLRALGVGPDRVVGVWMVRSAEMIVAQLAILKAGGAYAPFDVQAPEARLAAMIEIAGIELVLTSGRMRMPLGSLGARAACLDVDSDEIQRRPDSRPGVSPPAEGLACVMFTSGSTGEPKGVAVPHRGIVRLVRSAAYAEFGADEVFLHLSAPSFDASTFEVWGALLNGGRLALAPPGVPSVADIGTLVRRHGVTTLWLTAGLFQEMVDHGLEDLRPLRRLLAGGDVLSPAHVHRVLAALPGLRLVNGYGPTEGTTFTCCHTITAPPGPGCTVPIGRPIANTRVYVLDRHLQPVPIGVPGELWLGGDGLALGYIGRPQLTAERFQRVRLGPGLEERLYRTGDLVRWLRDGTLEFWGRLDDQLKVRGYRVEPGEIEAVLTRHPKVSGAAVVARPVDGGERRLVAYIVGEGAIDPGALREFVALALPEYMVPALFVAVDRLPLAVNGKVDRGALPEPERPTTALQPPVAPRDELERRLVGIWRDVLAVPLGVRDSFFDLGGHSLLAVRLFARLEAELGIDLPLATLFEAPTIERLAAFVRDTAHLTSGRALVAIQPGGSRAPLFGLPGVEGGVLGYHTLARLLGPDQPFYGLQSRGLDGRFRPLTRIEDIAHACVAEIRELQPRGPYHIVGACMGGVVAWEMARQLRAAGHEVGLVALIDTWPPEAAALAAGRRGWRPRAPVILDFVAGRVRLYREKLAELRGSARLRYLAGRLKPLSDLARHRDPFRGVRADLRRHAVTRANLLAFERYEPRPYAGPVVLFCAEGRSVFDETDGRLRWRQLAGALEVHSVAADDSGQLLREPHVRTVAAGLAAHLARPTAPTGPRA
jgi:amino acid adenylation domain-containing protein